ncbi:MULTISPECIES: MFS transporter [unclassified Nocardioides]|uniref:MFS transporter n=1 Tax=unclassified Nocardioides TaxID=2615069 RepID=UPI0009F1602D|nr:MULTISPECIES: MFS transporter [unclassified Nocardioides]GAW48403.1 major facilitator transporter [Nocardioides sp. PD653-B2]GAW53328.1 major facilitator transporter [Nocardioides sp. PD653]
MTAAGTSGVADLGPLERAREQKAWYWYDWANSAFVTTTAAVLFAPYLTSVAEKAACGRATDEDLGYKCTTDLHVLGLSLSAGSLVFYIVTAATILSALVLPVVGAVADRSSNKPRLLGGFAWAGSLMAMLMFFVAGSAWQLGAVLLLLATLFLGASLVVYDAMLVDIADPDERDRVSSRGWALGYLGGGLLLAVNFGLLTVMSDHTELAVRISLLSAGLWWAAFTIIPVRGVRARPPVNTVAEPGGLVSASFGQLWTTLKDLRRYPVTMTFLLAYLFYNDGIQTVIYAASVYGEKELGFEKSTVLLAFLVVQFVGIGGALWFGRVARRRGAYRVILVGLMVWLVVVVAGWLTPDENLPLFLLLAVAIGVVLGGTQALSRSFYSQLIPRGREAEYFSLYQACERGTSWIGTLIFGLVHQWTDSYRPALLALMVLFVIGIVLLSRVDPRRGIEEAGNTAPAVV